MDGWIDGEKAMRMNEWMSGRAQMRQPHIPTCKPHLQTSPMIANPVRSKLELKAR